MTRVTILFISMSILKWPHVPLHLKFKKWHISCFLFFPLLAIGPNTHIDLKKCSCHRVELKGQDHHTGHDMEMAFATCFAFYYNSSGATSPWDYLRSIFLHHVQPRQMGFGNGTRLWLNVPGDSTGRMLKTPTTPP